MMYRSTLSLVVFAALVGCGDEHGDAIDTMTSQIADLQASIHTQAETIEALQATLDAQNATINELEAQVANKVNRDAVQAIRDRVDTIETYMIVDPDEKTVTFEGVNVHIVSGSGTNNDDDTYTGLGNLQIGYIISESMSLTGSHNLSIGSNSAESHGSLLVGRNNVAKAAYNVVFGFENEAGDSGMGGHATILGGAKNTNYSPFSTIVGGKSNSIATGDPLWAVIIGGQNNEANSSYSIVP